MIQLAHNITQLNAVRNLRSAEHNVRNPNDIFFPVEQVALSSLTGMPDQGQSAIVRRDTNRILAVHGKQYKLTPNTEVYGAIDRLIERHETLDSTGLIINDQTAYAGGRTIRSYVFPEHSIKIGKGDETQLRINVLNSYDGSTNLQVMAGGYRIVCANGMVVGNNIAKFSARHTSSFNQNLVRHQIAASLDSFVRAGHKWQEWSTTRITDKQAMDIIDYHVGTDSEGKSKSERTRSDLVGYWLTEKAEIGSNLWALFNAFTYWSTHQEVKGASAGNRPAIVLEREKKVARTLGHSLFVDAA